MRVFFLTCALFPRLYKLRINLYKVRTRHLFFYFLVIGLVDTATADSCYPINSAQIIFGTYGPEFSQDLDMDTTIDIYCAPAFQGKTVNVKVHILDKAGTGDRHVLQNTSGQDKAFFMLFQDSTRTIPLTNDMLIPVIESVPHSKIFSIRLYGRLFAKQNIGKGLYATNLVINIDY